MPNGKPTPAPTSVPNKAVGANPSEKKVAPVANGASPGKDKTVSTPAAEDAGVKEVKEGSGAGEAAPGARPPSPVKKSLFIRGLPQPTEEADLKALFPSPDKVCLYACPPYPSLTAVTLDYECEDFDRSTHEEAEGRYHR